MKTEIAPYIPDLPAVRRSASGQFAATTRKRLAAVLCLLFLGFSTVFGSANAEDAAEIKARDAAEIKASKEAIVVGQVSHGRNGSELRFIVTDCWRGNIREGSVLYITTADDGLSDEQTGFEPGSLWIVMGTEKDGMFLCGDNNINYKYTHDRANWVQKVLGLIPE